MRQDQAPSMPCMLILGLINKTQNSLAHVHSPLYEAGRVTVRNSAYRYKEDFQLRLSARRSKARPKDHPQCWAPDTDQYCTAAGHSKSVSRHSRKHREQGTVGFQILH
jgi:hypothetical protein